MEHSTFSLQHQHLKLHSLSPITDRVTLALTSVLSVSRSTGPYIRHATAWIRSRFLAERSNVCFRLLVSYFGNGREVVSSVRTNCRLAPAFMLLPRAYSTDAVVYDSHHGEASKSISGQVDAPCRVCSPAARRGCVPPRSGGTGGPAECPPCTSTLPQRSPPQACLHRHCFHFFQQCLCRTIALTGKLVLLYERSRL